MKLSNKLIPLAVSALLVSQATNAGSHALSFGIQDDHVNVMKDDGIFVPSSNGEGVIPPKPKSISPEGSVCLLGLCLKP